MSDKAKAAGEGPMVSEVARALKALRIRSGLSIAAMAKELGMTATGHQHYEDRFKKERFPPDFLVKVTSVLRRLGATEEELAELGQFTEATGQTLVEILDELRRLRQEVVALRQDRSRDDNA